MKNPFAFPHTPVLIWVDLPPEKRLDDDPEATNRIAPRLPSAVRCVARSRGDSFLAQMHHVPTDGGYRCWLRARISGLCYRHYNAASPAVRRRAAELASKGGTP